MKWYTYWFSDNESGEEFFVEIEESNTEKAYKIARRYFLQPRLIGIVSEEEAEMMGLDTY